MTMSSLWHHWHQEFPAANSKAILPTNSWGRKNTCRDVVGDFHDIDMFEMIASFHVYMFVNAEDKNRWFQRGASPKWIISSTP